MCLNLEDISFHYYNVHKRKRFCGKLDDANFRMWQRWNRVHLVLLAYHVIVMIQVSAPVPLGMTPVEGCWLPYLVCSVTAISLVSVHYLGVSGRWRGSLYSIWVCLAGGVGLCTVFGCLHGSPYSIWVCLAGGVGLCTVFGCLHGSLYSIWVCLAGGVGLCTVFGCVWQVARVSVW